MAIAPGEMAEVTGREFLQSSALRLQRPLFATQDKIVFKLRGVKSSFRKSYHKIDWVRNSEGKISY